MLSAAFRPHPGGVSTHVTDLATSLATAGDTVTVFTLRAGKPDVASQTKVEAMGNLLVIKWGMRLVEEYWGRRVPFDKIRAHILKKWKDIQADLVHAHDYDSLFLGTQLAVSTGIPLVFTVHEAPRRWRPGLFRQPARAKTCYLEFVRRHGGLQGMVVPSQASKGVLAEQGFGLPGTYPLLRVIPHGIGNFLKSLPGQSDALNSLNLEAGRPLVFCPTRADVHKDVPTFLRAASLVRQRLSRSPVFLVADDLSRDQDGFVTTIAHKLGLTLGSDLHFRSFQYQDMAAVYQRASIVVVPSPRESFGLTVLEAFLFGRPVIVANQGALPEVVTDGKNGLHFEFGDHEELADRIEELLTWPEVAGELGRAGAQLVANNQRFSRDRMVADHRSFYEEVLQSHARAGEQRKE
jgi:glycosyltransferase involved in cell wall biosynthesis